MRRMLGTAAVLALLLGAAACGEGSDSAVDASDPASTSSSTASSPSSPTSPSSPSSPTKAPPDPTDLPDVPDSSDVVLLDGPDAGGAVDVLRPVTTDAELSTLTSQLTSEAFVTDVRRAVEDARAAAGPDGTVLAGVVAIGCEAPDAITLEPGQGGFSADVPKARTQIQCLVPITTVAVVTDPADA